MQQCCTCHDSCNRQSFSSNSITCKTTQQAPSPPLNRHARPRNRRLPRPHRRPHLRQHHRHRTGRAGTRTTTQGAPRKAPGITSCDHRRNLSIRCTRYTSSCTARGKRCRKNRLKSQRICFRCLRPDGNHPKTLGHRPNRRQRCNGQHEQRRGSSFTHHRPGSNRTTQVPAKAGEGENANNLAQ